MRKQTWLVGVAGAAVLAGAITFTTVRAAGGDDDRDDDHEVDAPITGGDLRRASAAALAHVGAGRVTGTEVGDEESYYEVEVTLDDGSQVDVQLDEGFAVVGQEGGRDRPGDGD